MKEIEDSTLLMIAIFTLMLGSALLGLFIYLYVKAMRADSRLACTRLHLTINKIRKLDNVNEQTFKEFEMLVNRKLKIVFVQRIAHITSQQGVQTE